MKTTKTSLINSLRILSHTGLLLLLTFMCTYPIRAAQFESIKKKEINKNFSVGKNDLLQVDNRYGNITISSWNKKEVAIRVEIEAKAHSDQKAQAILDRIHIQLEKSGGTVSAITSIAPDNSDGSEQSFTINYSINMPAELSCHLTQKYGNIHMPENNKGKCDLHAKYGNIHGGTFNAPLNIDIKYGNLEIANTTDELTIVCKYGNLTMEKVSEMDTDIKYGNIQIEELGNGVIKQKYGNSTIQKVKKGIAINELGYSKFHINELASDFTQISAEARYSTLNIKTDKKSSFKVKAGNMKYGNCKIKGFNVSLQSQKLDTSDFDSKKIKKDNTDYDLLVNGGKGGRILFNGNKYSNLYITAE
jgi:hypothetical protein